VRPTRCPKCRGEGVRRSPRRSLVDELLVVVALYPFRCQHCMHRFHARGRHQPRGNDRREYDRLEVRLPASLTFHGSQGTGLVTGLSWSGAAIDTEMPLALDALVQLEIRAPAGGPIAVDGALVRSVRRGAVGVQFVSMRAEAKLRLRDWLLEARHAQRSLHEVPAGGASSGQRFLPSSS
jgi:PilZ domain